MTTANETSAVTANGSGSFSPTCLTNAQWALASEPVLKAISSVPDLSLRQQGLYASRLCAFLAASSWDRMSVPDLAGLLTVEGVSEAVSADRLPQLSPRSLARFRTDLRRIGRGIGSVPAVAHSHGPHSSRPGQSFWLAARTVPVPFVVLAAAYASGGLRCHATMWAGFGQEMAAGGDFGGLSHGWINETGSSPAVRVGLSDAASSVVCAVRTVRAANDCDPQAVTVMATKKSTPGKAVLASSPTGRARAARAKLKANQSQPECPAVTEASLPVLDVDVEATIAAYRPAHFSAEQWSRIAPTVRLALRAYAPTSSRWVHDQAGSVTGFVVWVDQINRATASGPLTADRLLESGLVDRYLSEALAGRPAASRATARSVLRRVVRNLLGTPRESIEYSPVQAPYTPAECAAFVRLARNQPTDDLRRALSAVVALGLGAGLDGPDQRAVTPEDVTDVELGDGTVGLLVRVRGQRPRTVVVRADYEPLLREAIDAHNASHRGDKTPIYGLLKSRRNVTSVVTSRAVTATGVGVDINAARLRSTWLLACMNAPVPLNVLLSAAGLKSARTLTDLLAYCPPVDPAQAAAVLHALESHTTGGGGSW